MPRNLTCAEGTLYFAATDGTTGTELWKTDGTAEGTTLVRDIRPGPLGSNPAHLTVVNRTLLFQATDEANGTELWQSDGSNSGTKLVRDINAGRGGSFPMALTLVGDRVYFAASDGRHGMELWSSDGSSDGTRMVADLAPGALSGAPNRLSHALGSLFFVASNGAQFGLWRYDFASTPRLIRNFTSERNESAPDFLTEHKKALYFSADDGKAGVELWKSDGTPEGTQLVIDIYQDAVKR